MSLEKGAKTWVSLLLTMSGSLIYATSVDDLTAVTRIAPLWIQTHLQRSNNNLVNSYALHLTYHSISPSSLF